jgi:hypothetical protein
MYFRFTFAILLLTLSTAITSVSASASQDNVSFDPARAFQQEFYVQSNLEFTLLHELAHAVIELNDIPVLGGQEQAADQIALMLLIMADDSNKKDINPDVLNKLLAISGEWMLEWQEEKQNSQPIYWDTHPLAIQRFYEVTCLVYGSDPDKLESLRKESMLPVERAWDCDIEFEKTREALAWLVTKVSDFEFNESWDLVKVRHSKEQFSGRIKVVWIEPSSQEQKRIYALLKSFNHLADVLERINNLLNLKTDITVYMEPFCRAPDAWWDGTKNNLTVCYDLIKQFERNSLLLPNLVKQLKSGPSE